MADDKTTVPPAVPPADPDAATPAAPKPAPATPPAPPAAGDPPVTPPAPPAPAPAAATATQPSLAGKYRLRVASWSQRVKATKAGQKDRFVKHRMGAVIDLDDVTADRLLVSGSIEPADSSIELTVPDTPQQAAARRRDRAGAGPTLVRSVQAPVPAPAPAAPPAPVPVPPAA